MDMQPDTYSTASAARILGLSPRRVQQLAERGDIEGKKFDDREWSLYQHSVHAYLEHHGPGKRGRGRMLAGIETALEPSETAREWADRVADLERQLGRLEGRLELTERAESTLQESLQRERERADAAEDRTAQLQAELDAERAKGFWRRLFGS